MRKMNWTACKGRAGIARSWFANQGGGVQVVSVK
jgi:hypothetical protein